MGAPPERGPDYSEGNVMGDYAEAQMRHEFRRGMKHLNLPRVPSWPKVACPICGKECGGRGDTQNEGVHQHMKFKHGIKAKWKREAMITVKGER